MADQANRAPFRESHARLNGLRRSQLTSSTPSSASLDRRTQLVRSITSKKLNKRGPAHAIRFFQQKKLSHSESNLYQKAFKKGNYGVISTTASSSDLVIENWLRATPVLMSPSHLSDCPPFVLSRDNYQLWARSDRKLRRAEAKSRAKLEKKSSTAAFTRTITGASRSVGGSPMRKRSSSRSTNLQARWGVTRTCSRSLSPPHSPRVEALHNRSPIGLEARGSDSEASQCDECSPPPSHSSETISHPGDPQNSDKLCSSTVSFCVDQGSDHASSSQEDQTTSSGLSASSIGTAVVPSPGGRGSGRQHEAAKHRPWWAQAESADAQPLNVDEDDAIAPPSRDTPTLSSPSSERHDGGEEEELISSYITMDEAIDEAYLSSGDGSRSPAYDDECDLMLRASGSCTPFTTTSSTSETSSSGTDTSYDSSYDSSSDASSSVDSLQDSNGATSSTAGPTLREGRTGLPVDWNDRFQSILEQSDGTEEEMIRKYTSLRNLYHDFLATCKRYAKIIISEVNMNDEYKTVLPCNVGGQAGGEKYIYHGILFKFTHDVHGFYGGDQYSMKSAGHELRSLTHFFGMPGLNVPLMSVVDYRGYRIVGMSILPISSATLVYGSMDAGKSVKKDANFHKVMGQAAERLHLKPHVVGQTIQKMIYGPVDIEGHRGAKDGRLYVLDLARVFPPTTPDAGVRGCYLHRLLRPEMVLSHPEPLSSDAHSPFGSHDAAIHNAAVDACTTRLKTEVVLKCAKAIVDLFGRARSSSSMPTSQVPSYALRGSGGVPTLPSGHRNRLHNESGGSGRARAHTSTSVVGRLPTHRSADALIPTSSSMPHGSMARSAAAAAAAASGDGGSIGASSSAGAHPVARSVGKGHHGGGVDGGGKRLSNSSSSRQRHWDAKDRARSDDCVGHITGEELTEEMHRLGINMRYMGLLRKAVAGIDHSGSAGLCKCIFIEILARCAKNRLRQLWRDNTMSRSSNELLGHSFKEIALIFINGIMVSPSTTAEELFHPHIPTSSFWTDPNLLTDIRYHYGEDALSDHPAKDLLGVVSQGPYLLQLVHRICALCRIHLSPRALHAVQERLLHNHHAELLTFDIESVGARTKHIPIISFAEAQLLSSKARQLIREGSANAAERAFSEAEHHFQAAKRASPGNNTHTHAFATACLLQASLTSPLSPKLMQYFKRAYEVGSELHPPSQKYVFLYSVASQMMEVMVKLWKRERGTSGASIDAWMDKLRTKASLILEELAVQTPKDARVYMMLGRLWLPRCLETYASSEASYVVNSSAAAQSSISSDVGERLPLKCATPAISLRDWEKAGIYFIQAFDIVNERKRAQEESIGDDDDDDDDDDEVDTICNAPTWLVENASKLPPYVVSAVMAMVDACGKDLKNFCTSKCCAPLIDKQLPIMIKMCPEFRVIEFLGMASARLDNRFVLAALKKCSSLRVLSLKGIGTNSTPLLRAIESTSETLEELKLHDMWLEGGVMKMLSTLNSLRVLHLTRVASACGHDMKQRVEWTGNLCDSLSTLSGLRELNLDVHWCLPSVMGAIAEACAGLRVLKLGDKMCLSDSSIANALCSGLKKLRMFSLKDIGLESVMALASNQNELQYLYAESIDHDDYLSLLGKSCPKLVTLAVIKHEFNKSRGCSEQGLRDLASNCPHLQCITIHGVNMTKELVQTFTRGCPLLEDVSLSGCTLSKEALLAFAENSRHLRVWRLRWNDQLTFEDLQPALSHTPGLIRLDLTGCVRLRHGLFEDLCYACPPTLRALMLAGVPHVEGLSNALLHGVGEDHHGPSEGDASYKRTRWLQELRSKFPELCIETRFVIGSTPRWPGGDRTRVQQTEEEWKWRRREEVDM